ncbi:hypothetical protein KKI34_15815 [Pseudoalteromonas tetraodonis]|uniref:sugar-transfer associated ATP-grasp domain-containing protein n=1 Tax=Pseudoalteromonas tetraodonis TaxID=43659 RepID=UPI001BDE1CD6|nr:sugar-transfer associated ATP-grasp domain-containing protein [Pseudoalteromonas tetraodonis]MBT2153197.1 hypothetical protein [Pseudoalteromonas tetraodonis]
MLSAINKSRLGNLYNDVIFKMFRDSQRKPFFKQLKELFLLGRAIKYWPNNYFKYDGYKKDKSLEDTKLYVTGVLFGDFRKQYLNDSRYAVFADDKFLFHKLMADAGIPTAKLINVISFNPMKQCANGLNEERAELILDSITADSIVIKPVIDSIQGDGVHVINVCHDEPKKFEVSGVFYNSEELLNKLFTGKQFNRKYLIEETIQQSTFAAELYPDSVNTVRIDSLLSQTGEVFINSAFLRLGKGGRKVDNWSGDTGGIGVKINIESGALSSEGIDYSKNLYSKHPDTCVSFSGLIVPQWEEVISIVKKAAIQFPQLKSLGWDIALTDNGPLILEVNADYGILSMQTCSQALGANKLFYNELVSYAKDTPYSKYFAVRSS